MSNKVRQLGRLLIPLQDIYKINSILEVLKTKYYDKVVHAVKIISAYDNNTKTFKAPSLALHFKTILLGVCLAAKTLLLKEEPSLLVSDYKNTLKEVKNFCSLVNEKWKFDMGSLALKILMKNMEKKFKIYQ